MISVEEAKELVATNSFQLSPVNKNIAEAIHFVLAENIFSPIAYPPFDQSAMDGYAIKYSDFVQWKKIKIVGESSAGHPFKEKIVSGQAVQIFTGAKIPYGADTVVMQEYVTIENEHLIIDNPNLSAGLNIRKKSSQTKKGAIVLQKGNILNPGAIGFLSGLGITSVKVIPEPKVTVIVTGNELQKPGKPLAEGKVYESNSFALNAALESLQIKAQEIISVRDSEKNISDEIKKAISTSDLVLIAGGISVGKYDFVGKALKQLGVKNIFYKVFQKPGKPLYFGKYKKRLLFGLPGNPAAALTCFYEYVFSAIRKMQGHERISLETKNISIASGYSKKEGLALFLKGKITDGKVHLLSGQESSNLSSFALADCLIYLPANKKNITDGESVEIHLLPMF